MGNVARLVSAHGRTSDALENPRARDGPFVPAVVALDKSYVANEKYKDAPGAVLRVGNLPHSASQGVHSGEDVILTATGPGADRVRGFLDNTEVFRIIVDALGLGASGAQ